MLYPSGISGLPSASSGIPYRLCDIYTRTRQTNTNLFFRKMRLSFSASCFVLGALVTNFGFAVALHLPEKLGKMPECAVSTELSTLMMIQAHWFLAIVDEVSIANYSTYIWVQKKTVNPSNSKCYDANDTSFTNVDWSCFCNDSLFLIDFINGHYTTCGQKEQRGRPASSP